MRDRIARLLILLTAMMIATPLLTSQRCLANQGGVVSWAGETMGTRYMVKVYSATPEPLETSDLRVMVDLELRRVNDQMSTYLRSSEITQFNDSQSTDWVDVSLELAQVVAFAQEVAGKTDGAFDVTVGPLINAWNFGPTPRTDQIPSDEMVAQLQKRVGYQNLSVRLTPPSMKKDIPELRVDLSAIAKGHGVDRVVEILNDEGHHDVFVEIGGEVRTSGSKSGKPWVVGIQVPDTVINNVDMAYPFVIDTPKRSMATSGDYRNYIEVDGKRYSHTLDPRTGKPIEHSLASVSIVTESCMQADAWATALNVLGPTQGKQVAQANDLDAVFIERSSEAFKRSGVGAMKSFVAQHSNSVASPKAAASATGTKTSQGFAIAFITFIAFASILFAMAVGVIFGGKAISGSCGGLNGTKNDDGTTRCSLCSNPTDACQELREKMNQPAPKA